MNTSDDENQTNPTPRAIFWLGFVTGGFTFALYFILLNMLIGN